MLDKLNTSLHLIPKNIHFLIGAMKSGTTTLMNVIESHPEVCPTTNKEPEFFSKGISEGEAYAGGDIESYLKLWSAWDPKTHKIAIDASTNYSKFLTPTIPNLIHNFNKNAKLIYITRNPFERIRSHYQMYLAKGWDIKPLSLGVDRHALEVTKYWSQLEYYRKLFPKESILVLSLDQLEANSQDTFSLIFNHLGIDPNIELINISKQHASDKYYGLDKILEKKLNIDKGKLRVAQENLAAQYCSFWTPSEKNRKEIKEYLKDDMRKLFLDYKINISSWGF